MRKMEVGSSSTKSSPHRGKPQNSILNLLDDLKADGVETSFELEGILQKQYTARDGLLQKVSTALLNINT